MENKLENHTSSICMNSQAIEQAMWGRPLEKAIHELLIILAVIRSFSQEENLTIEEIKKEAPKLFQAMKISYLTPEDIFTEDVVSQILKVQDVRKISFTIKGIPITLEPESTISSIINKLEEPT